jgi:hypothetical protein
MLTLFFLFFLFVLFEEGNAVLQHSVTKPSSYFLFAAQEKEEEGDGCRFLLPLISLRCAAA